MTTLLLALILVAVLGLAALVALGLCRAAAFGTRGEVAEVPGDDFMAVADAVTEPADHPDDCDCEDIALDGVTPEDQMVLRANWLALTDNERTELNDAFASVMEGADR